MAQMDSLKEKLAPAWESDRVQAEDFPPIDLYMDQVTTLLEGKLGDPGQGRSRKPLTATMLGNYTKEGLLKKIKGKKYPREHLLMMVLLYHLKGSLALGDIKALFGLVEEDFSLDRNQYNSAQVEGLFADFTRMQSAQAERIAALTAEDSQAFDLGLESPEQLMRSVLYYANLSNLASAAARELIAQYAPSQPDGEEQE